LWRIETDVKLDSVMNKTQSSNLKSTG
jgi:hypothetical protein